MIHYFGAIVLLYFVHYYLQTLKNCDCVNQTYVDHLKNIEMTFITINAVMLLFAILNHFHIYFPSVLRKYASIVIPVAVISMLSIYAYYAYTAYKFFTTAKKECKCDDKWQKYYLMVDSSLAAIIILVAICAVLGYVYMKLSK